jgi:hypothetical protein
VSRESAFDSEQGESVSIATQEGESMDLFHSDDTKVIADLDALDLKLDEDSKKCEKLVTAGGCFALVQLIKDYLKNAIEKCPACDQVTELNEAAELK